jgi:multidrug efflux system membrane fusion protein
MEVFEAKSPLAPKRKRPKWRLLMLLLCAAAVGYWGWNHLRDAPFRPGLQQGQTATPVHAAIVERRDFTVFLNGLGTVQATNNVVVRSRVDGQIEKVDFEEGEMVREGDLLVQIDAAPFQAALDAAIAKLAQDQASLTNAKQDLDRTAVLTKHGNATQQLLDQRIATVTSLTALIQADQAAIESAKVQLAYTTIRSPLTGRAGFRLVDSGNIVHATDQNGILTITQLQPIFVVFTAPEQHLPSITEALRSGPLAVTAFTPDGKKRLGDGILKLVDNQVDTASGTIRLKASFDNRDNGLWPGQSVFTRLLVKTLKDVVVVPDLAIQRGPNGLFAYVVTPASTAELRDLKVAQIEDGQALVEHGLSPGERVVTAGQYRVQPGTRLQIVDGQERKTAVKQTADKMD